MNISTPLEEEEKSKLYSSFLLQYPLNGAPLPYHRPRRNRKSAAIRSLVEETDLLPSDFIIPQFLIPGSQRKEALPSLPGSYRLTLDLLEKEVERVMALGIPAMMLFPVIPSENKDAIGSEALHPNGIVPQAIRQIKQRYPDFCLITDIALDPYTSHGHDGILNAEGEILNDTTVETLMRLALLHAEAGVDMVAPSDMMDGRVRALRWALDRHGYTHVNILAYSVKYASAFYTPFREALAAAPLVGNKKSYQMNPANSREALREVALDIEEGADILMIKPALPYLDIITKVRAATSLPLSAYQVSGEYAMIMAAAERGWLDADHALFESAISIKRAGADMMVTYAAVRLAQQLMAR